MQAGRRLARLSWALALATLACSGGYPLPPTRCDEFCDATKGGYCSDTYGPANCVAQCESSDTDSEACRVQFDATVDCFRNSPRALKQRCVYDDVPNDCDLEQQLLLSCVGQQHGFPGGKVGPPGP